MARTEFCLEDGVCLVLLEHWGHSWKRDQKPKSKYCCVYSIIPWANPETVHYWRRLRTDSSKTIHGKHLEKQSLH